MCKELEALERLTEYFEPFENEDSSKTKHYLKWEDLDTKPYTMKVKMGDNLYMLNWSYSNDDEYDDSKSVTLRTLNGDWLLNLYEYFFNDLHLERVK